MKEIKTLTTLLKMVKENLVKNNRKINILVMNHLI